MNISDLTDNPIITLILAIIIFIVVIKPYKIIKRNTKKSELDQYILTLNAKIRHPKKEYQPSKSIYERFCNNYKDDLVLTAMATDILKHCGYTPAALYVRIVDELPGENTAGRYQIKNHTSTIEIKKTPFMTQKTVLAILIHECMHFFLRCRNIGYEETIFNEKLTDITCIYMGFYDYIIDGYINGGYISRADMKYVKRAIDKM